jgi:glycosyltransferase involved in cell wall biosynthesis
VVYDIFDFYADHLRATPEVVKRLIRAVDLWAISRADALILVDDARRQQIAGSRPKSVTVIYNSPEDTPANHPAKASTPRPAGEALTGAPAALDSRLQPEPSPAGDPAKASTPRLAGEALTGAPAPLDSRLQPESLPSGEPAKASPPRPAGEALTGAPATLDSRLQPESLPSGEPAKASPPRPAGEALTGAPATLDSRLQPEPSPIGDPAKASPPRLAGAAPPAAPCGLRLAYIGLLQVERGLLDVLEALRRHPAWTLDLAGFGGDEAQILQAAAGMPNLTFYGRVSYEKAIQLSAAADVLFALYDPAIPNHRYSSPNKVFEALMLGKPVLVARHTNMDRIVEESGAGLVVDYGDVNAIEAALLRLAEQPGLRQALGQSARRAYERDYDWKVMQRRLLEVYRHVT